MVVPFGALLDINVSLGWTHGLERVTLAGNRLRSRLHRLHPAIARASDRDSNSSAPKAVYAGASYDLAMA